MFYKEDYMYRKNCSMFIDTIKELELKNRLFCNSKEYKLSRKILKLENASVNELVKKAIHKIKSSKSANNDFDDVKGFNNIQKIKRNYFCNSKIAVYTCIIGDYDNLIEPVFCPDNCDFYAITNFKIPNNSKWHRIDAAQFVETEKMTQVEANRYFKMFPYKIFPEYKYSLYIDGNVKLYTDATEFINRIPKEGMAFFKHAQRNSVYREAEACVAYGKADKKNTIKWTKFLKNEGMPKSYGLVQCSVIARDHSIQKMRDTMEQWWSYFYKGEIKRDQLILPYILFKSDIKINEICTLGENVWTYPGLETEGHN